MGIAGWGKITPARRSVCRPDTFGTDLVNGNMTTWIWKRKMMSVKWPLILMTSLRVVKSILLMTLRSYFFRPSFEFGLLLGWFRIIFVLFTMLSLHSEMLIETYIPKINKKKMLFSNVVVLLGAKLLKENHFPLRLRLNVRRIRFPKIFNFIARFCPEIYQKAK